MQGNITLHSPLTMCYQLGGYFLKRIQPIEFGSHINQAVFTCSTCINDSLLDNWSYSWTSDNDKGIRAVEKSLGLNDAAIESIRAWTDVKFDDEKSIGWPDIFFDVDTAKIYYSTYFSHLESVMVFALYFTENEAQEIIKVFSPTDSGSGLIGLVNSLQRKVYEADKAGEKTIGYDLIGIENGGSFHTFHCHDLSNELVTKFGLSLNPYGLFDDTDDWGAVVDYLNDEKNGFEPVPWFVTKVKTVAGFDKL